MTEPTHRLVVQFPMAERGTEKDAQFCYRLAEVLDGALKEAESGYVEGGDLGGGAMRINLVVEDPGRAGLVVIEALRSEELLDRAAVYRREGDTTVETLWPEGQA